MRQQNKKAGQLSEAAQQYANLDDTQIIAAVIIGQLILHLS